ncbi:hypothetical protein DYB36_005622 [Aphanomyces astaci]|uniref:Heparinase II/III-like C-terminal domain-containing protein n=2 Tax=Aphanomyces astaci TaxID=112090 RepID=A0A396ZR89_APHAT|nr:hypothetical protein DYB36_005622 [Aphanomyces astaci]
MVPINAFTCVAVCVTFDDVLAVLSDDPQGYAMPCSNRTFWQPILDANGKAVAAARADGRKHMNHTFPLWRDDAYLLYSLNGDRAAGETMMAKRHEFARDLLLAECYDMNGEFLSKLEDSLVSYATQRTWVLAAHDPKLDVFYGRSVFVDLNAALVSSFFGSALYMLGDALSLETTTAIRDALDARTVGPQLDRLVGSAIPFWWQLHASNWNAVCFNGMTSAILTAVDDKQVRAAALVAIIDQSQAYLGSFFDDGYGAEGVGYYNYGFEEFAELREKVCDATQGTVDLFDNANVGTIAHLSQLLVMRNQNVASFGDAHAGLRFSYPLTQYSLYAYGDSKIVAAPNTRSVPGKLMSLLLPVTMKRSCPELYFDSRGSVQLRHVFEQSKIAVFRGTDASLFDMTFKVAGNGGHSHNDMGSYSIAFNNTIVLGDAGGPLYYDAQSFGTKRYKSPLINSYGHPVPVVANKNQSEAAAVQKKHKFTLATTFSALEDTATTDLAAAYAEPALKRLQRKVTFSRSGLGHISIDDTVEMQPGASVNFETVFTPLGAWTSTGANSGLVRMKSGDTVLVCIDASAPFSVQSQVLSSYNVTWTRVGVKVASAKQTEHIKVKVLPGSATCALRTDEQLS